MNIQTFIKNIQEYNQIAVINHGKHYSYKWVINKIYEYKKLLRNQKINQGAIVQLNTDFSPYSIAMLFALASTNCIVVPMTNVVLEKQKEYQSIVKIEHIISFKDTQVIFELLQHNSSDDLIKKLRKDKCPGLIIMSSGSTGKSKAIVHDFNKLLNAFKEKKNGLRTLAFLLFDHIGGFNTMLCTMYNGGTLVIPDRREVDSVAKVIELEKVEALVTSPSFLNLLLLSHAYKQYDLTSIKIINYGSEPMPESLLQRLNTIFPKIRFSQSYGMSELGVMKVKSKSSDSLLIKVDENQAQIRINNGMLEVKLNHSMLGYLNADASYIEDGWFQTGDMVIQQDDGYIKILGRKSDIINVGGEKVYPVEIENVLLKMEGIEDAVVSGEPNAILGNIVKVKLRISPELEKNDFKIKLRLFCKEHLPSCKVPHKIEFVDYKLYSQRFKKMRSHNINGDTQ